MQYGYGPVIDFTYAFPTSGRYQLWPRSSATGSCSPFRSRSTWRPRAPGRDPVGTAIAPVALAARFTRPVAAIGDYAGVLDMARNSLRWLTSILDEPSLPQVPLAEGNTVLVIAHRLPTVVAADRIVVLDDGRIAETGAPTELLGAQGRHARFWESRRQAKGWRLTS